MFMWSFGVQVQRLCAFLGMLPFASGRELSLGQLQLIRKLLALGLFLPPQEGSNMVDIYVDMYIYIYIQYRVYGIYIYMHIVYGIWYYVPGPQKYIN